MNEPKLQTVRLYKPHTHAGTKYKPGPDGIELQVNAPDAKFMKSVGVLDKPAPIVTATPTLTPPSMPAPSRS